MTAPTLAGGRLMRSFKLGEITLADTRSRRLEIDMNSIEAGGYPFTRRN